MAVKFNNSGTLDRYICLGVVTKDGVVTWARKVLVAYEARKVWHHVVCGPRFCAIIRVGGNPF